MNLEKGEEITVAKLPSGKWGALLRLNGHEEPFNLGREFKTEEVAEGWLDTTEANNLIDQFITKYRNKA
ncbi:MAG TPA: hypothetical protein VEQ35_04175 [Beijerinckia sp.]|jgi:hypothetical protein|nr:hypothetical protein [Beijerinckia sp.]